MFRRVTIARAMLAPLIVAAASVCAAQAPEHSARLIVQHGQVSAWIDNGPRALFMGDLVKPQQMIVTGPDGYAQFQVSDGSTFEVFPNSKLVFREHLGNVTDLLNVIIGQVKVFIQHLNGQPNNNKVSSPTAVISVRGTVFSVVVEDDDGTTFVSVDEGMVSVRNQTAPGAPVNLQPGESIRVFRNQPLAARAVDKGSVFRAIIRAAEQAVYEIVARPTSGGLAGGRPGAPIPNGPANGDAGKGGGSTPDSPGGATAPGAPGAPGRP